MNREISLHESNIVLKVFSLKVEEMKFHFINYSITVYCLATGWQKPFTERGSHSSMQVPCSAYVMDDVTGDETRIFIAFSFYWNRLFTFARLVIWKRNEKIRMVAVRNCSYRKSTRGITWVLENMRFAISTVPVRSKSYLRSESSLVSRGKHTLAIAMDYINR